MEEIKLYKPSKSDKEIMTKIVIQGKYHKILYKKINNNKYRIFCTICNQYEYVDRKTYLQIKNSKVCPMCFCNVTSITNRIQDFTACNFVAIGQYGYAVMVQYRFGYRPKVNIRQVAYFDKDNRRFYTRDIGMTMFGHSLWYYPNTSFWKRRSYRNHTYSYYGAWEYEDLFYDIERFRNPINYMPYLNNKKKYLENVASCIEKSNQKKIAIENLLNENQIKFMWAFDLKSYDEIIKYNKMCGKVYETYNHDYLKLLKEIGANNIYYLDYFARTGISFAEYYDYAKNLKLLGFKLDKPKKEDFAYRNEKVAEMVAEKEDEITNAQIKQRAKTLPEYHKDNISILPFKSSEEIIKCGKKLHNCIGGYVEDYAEGGTDLYHLNIDKALKVAIEIQKGGLEQAYANKNADCPKDLFEHIKEFCKQNGFHCENYSYYYD